jgi:hypothetical protein
MIKKLYLATLTVFLSVIVSFAQTTAIKVTVIDDKTGETVPFASITAEIKGVQQGSGAADINGEAVIKPLNAGTYSVKVTFLGYIPREITNVQVQEGKTTYLDVKLAPSVEVIKEFVKTEYVVPLVDQNKTTSQSIVDRKTFMALPNREIGAVVSQAAGVYQAREGQGVSIKGARSETNRAGGANGESATKVFIDGQRVVGSSGIPQSAVENIAVITGGIPAEFGDATAGVINITTRGPQPKYFGGVEAITSQGLDKFGYNFLNFSVGGPLLYKKNEDGEKRPILGFIASGELITDKDPQPTVNGAYKIKDDVMRDLERNPLRPNINGGALRNAEFIRNEDIEKIAYRQNVRSNTVRFNGKLDYQPVQNINITLGGSYDYNKNHDYTRAYALFNPQNNSQGIDQTWRVFARFRQKFGKQGKDDKSSSLISNAYYQIQVGYTSVYNITQDDVHQDQLQNYGYVGKFKTYKRNSYAFGVDETLNKEGYLLNSYDNDTLVVFTPDTITNPITTRYTQQYMDITKDFRPNGLYNTVDAIYTNGGMINGFRPQSVYNLWHNTGRQPDGYTKINNTQFRVNGNLSLDVKSHSIQLGFEFEQRDNSRYSIAPVGLWNRARQLVNFHIADLDKTKPIPIFKDGIYQDTIMYNRKFDSTLYNGYAKNFRTDNGIEATTYVDLYNIDKDQLKLTHFSADNLFLSGGGDNLITTAYGYDVHGNKLKGNTAFADFWKKDENNEFRRNVGSYRPNYFAMYIQDVFDFKDIKFNVGLRYDRFDANQQVLRDPYLFYEAHTVATKGGANTPSNIGSDYVIYVDDFKKLDPKILGYRDPKTQKWYNTQGKEISDPKAIADESVGGINPWLVNPEDATKNNIKSETFVVNKSFTDYIAQNNFMPRVSFSFPISDLANFFAHYDILTQRPPASNRMDPTDYFFLQNNVQLPINNPNLKPEKTIDYELGYSQLLGEDANTANSAITITAFYRDMRNMIQVVRANYAYPISYLTYGNIDFGTVKGITFKYDLRRTRNLTLNVNYTLQFADGTGSSTTDAFSLLNSGQPNLRAVTPLDIDQRHSLVINSDYRFASGVAYNGPRINGKEIFANTGLNVTYRFGSGIPYTKNAYISRQGDIAPAGSGPIEGMLNGSRMPSNFRMDLRLDRNIKLNFGKKESENRKSVNLNVYLQVLNVLNTINVLEVYQATGNPNDDGYLTFFRSQAEINQQINPASYIDLYRLKLDDPRNFGLPRRVRFGCALDF